MNLAERLKWLRIKHGLASKKIAAAAIGIKYGTYQRYEYGANPSRKKFEEIATYYKCSLSWLMTGEGDPYPKAGSPETATGHLYIKEGQTAYPGHVAPAAPQAPPGTEIRISISEALHMTARVLESGTPYAVALYLNIQQFSGAIEAAQELHACRDRITNLETQVGALRRQVDGLTATPASSDQPAASLEKEAM